jgi:hypothetical protein
LVEANPYNFKRWNILPNITTIKPLMREHIVEGYYFTSTMTLRIGNLYIKLR